MFLRRVALGILAGAVLLAVLWLASGRPDAGELMIRYLALRSGTGGFESNVAVRSGVLVPMRDGIRLATDLYLPNSAGTHPAILVRTPYGKGEGALIGRFFARYGYAVAVQDTRGRHKSEGEFYPFRAEAADGGDLARWVRRQPWSNGRVGAFGLSYLGFTQWAMAADDPDLTAISPAFITSDLYRGIYEHGAFGELTFLHWSLTSYGRWGNTSGAANIARGYGHFPLVEADDVALRNVDFYDDWVRHPAPDAYWQALGTGYRMPEMRAPAFLVAGWYDFFRDAQIRDFQAYRRSGPGKKAWLLVGPWSHGFWNAHGKDYGIRRGMGEAVPFEFVRESKQWLDYTLKGAEKPWVSRAPVRVYVLGENAWRDAADWPPPDAVERSYYLRADGRLDKAPPAAPERESTYEYDPAHPVPSNGGSHGDARSCGPADQREVESRPDVLVYSSEPLQSPRLVMGMVKVRLSASSTATDTDFTAKLVDVQPDGRALILCEGVVRARYRDGLDQARFLTPGAVYNFEIEAGNIAVLFERGHRIRLEVSSSNAPRYDPNPNTGREIATERNPVRAVQKIFHTPSRESRLVLPELAR